jgi:hypothetical protein
VGYGVGVGVTQQPLFERNALPSKNERPPSHQAMAVVTDADANQAATSTTGSRQL